MEEAAWLALPRRDVSVRASGSPAGGVSAITCGQPRFTFHVISADAQLAPRAGTVPVLCQSSGILQGWQLPSLHRFGLALNEKAAPKKDAS